MSKNADFPESVQEELEQYVAQLTEIRASVAPMTATDTQREIVTEIDALLVRCQTKDLATTLKSEELCNLTDRIIAVQERSTALSSSQVQAASDGAAK